MHLCIAVSLEVENTPWSVRWNINHYIHLGLVLLVGGI